MTPYSLEYSMTRQLTLGCLQRLKYVNRQVEEGVLTVEDHFKLLGIEIAIESRFFLPTLKPLSHFTASLHYIQT